MRIDASRHRLIFGPGPARIAREQRPFEPAIQITELVNTLVAAMQVAGAVARVASVYGAWVAPFTSDLKKPQVRARMVDK